MTNMTVACMHGREGTDLFLQYDDDVVQSTHYVQECGEGMLSEICQ